jgi:NodT family efflux transporter outer membrane factor (OMF) lipoprotein
MIRMLMRTCSILVAAALAGSLCACAVGPDYKRPGAPAATAYKEAGANPVPAAQLPSRGDWWTVFDDPALNALAARVEISNQNVAAAEAAYRQAEALVREQRAALFPVVDTTAGVTRSGSGGRGGGTIVSTGGGSNVVSGGGGKTTNTYRASIGASWEPDVWGRIRRTIEGAHGAAQASEADLAAARLSAQGSLAVDYFDLRQTDSEIALLTEVAAGYRRSLQITQNRYDAGVAPHSDVLQAQSQLATTEADISDLGRQRAQFEHAIAVLVGETPSSFSIAAVPAWRPVLPAIPAGVPSTLLKRRPDIAAAERRAASASAQIGVQMAAFFPDLTLSGSYGFAGSKLGGLFSAATNVWSISASAAETLFDAGARGARVSQARAAYDQAVAQYRQTVLAAFQDVEDQLAAQRALADEYELRRQAAADAQQAAVMVLNQYREGQVDYTSVATAQASALNARRTFVQAAGQRQTTAAALIQALGGGWTAPF